MKQITEFKELDNKLTNNFSSFVFAKKVGRFLIKLEKNKVWHHDTPDYDYQIIDLTKNHYYSNSGRDTKNSPHKPYAALVEEFSQLSSEENILVFLKDKKNLIPNSSDKNFIKQKIETNSKYF